MLGIAHWLPWPVFDLCHDLLSINHTGFRALIPEWNQLGSCYLAAHLYILSRCYLGLIAHWLPWSIFAYMTSIALLGEGSKCYCMTYSVLLGEGSMCYYMIYIAWAWWGQQMLLHDLYCLAWWGQQVLLHDLYCLSLVRAASVITWSILPELGEDSKCYCMTYTALLGEGSMCYYMTYTVLLGAGSKCYYMTYTALLGEGSKCYYMTYIAMLGEGSKCYYMIYIACACWGQHVLLHDLYCLCMVRAANVITWSILPVFGEGSMCYYMIYIACAWWGQQVLLHDLYCPSGVWLMREEPTFYCMICRACADQIQTFLFTWWRLIVVGQYFNCGSNCLCIIHVLKGGWVRKFADH